MGTKDMTPVQNFSAFKDLQELTGATDSEIEAMLVYGCKQSPAANFEDVVTEHLLRLFRAITGVQWIRGWEQGARPDGQFATVWLYGSKMIGPPEVEYVTVIDGATNTVLPDLCEVVYQHIQYQFQLDSYRDNGAGNRNQDGAVQQGPKFSAVDVLTRLTTAFGHSRFRDALREQCLYLNSKPFGDIRNLAKPLVQNTYEGRANVDFFVHVRTMSSLRSPAYGNIDWGFLCPTDEQLYPDPPAVAIC
jgi:hypothetical protein